MKYIYISLTVDEQISIFTTIRLERNEINDFYSRWTSQKCISLITRPILLGSYVT